MNRSSNSFLGLVLLGFASLSSHLVSQENIQQATISSNAEPIVKFQRHQFSVSRQNGKILIDGKVVANHFHQKSSKEIALIQEFDNVSFSTDKEFNDWARKLRSTRTYTYDEVTQVDSDGKSTTKPLVLFDLEHRKELDPKWQTWLDKRQAEIEESNRGRLAQEREARTYQLQAQLQQLQTQALNAQVAAAERSAASLAVISGETSLWEVELVPGGQVGSCSSCSSGYSSFPYGFGYETSGVSLSSYGRGNFAASFGNYSTYGQSGSFSVKSYGRTSLIASENAVSSYPGYRVGTIRKLAGY